MFNNRISPPLLYRYIFAEILSPFAVSTFVFTGVLFLVPSLKLIHLVVNKNVPVGDILLLFSYVIPRFLEVAIPMSLLLGVILAFGRLSSDSELVVIRATGISIKRLAVPVTAFAAFAFVLTLVIGMWLSPWANYQLGVGIFEIAKMRAGAGLVPGVFNKFGQLTIYAENADQNTGRLSNVIIADRRNSESGRNFIAKHGHVISDEQTRALTLRLYDGSIHEGRGLNYRLTYFDVNNVSLDEKALSEREAARKGKKTSEMFIGELTEAIEDYKAKPQPLSVDDRRLLAGFQVEFHRRFVIPTACLCIALIAMALGIQPSRGGLSWGPAANIIVGIFVILTYYFLFALASAYGQQGVVPPWIIVWLPNVAFAALAVYLYKRVGSEQWLAVSQKLGEIFDYVRLKCRIVEKEHLEETH